MNNFKFILLTLLAPALFYSGTLAMQTDEMILEKEQKETTLGKRDLANRITRDPKKQRIEQDNLEINQLDFDGNTRLHRGIFTLDAQAFCVYAQAICAEMKKLLDQGASLHILNIYGKSCSDIILEKLIAYKNHADFSKNLNTYITFLAVSTNTPISTNIRTLLYRLEALRGNSNGYVQNQIARFMQTKNRDGFIAYTKMLVSVCRQLTNPEFIKELQEFFIALCPTKSMVEIEALCNELFNITFMQTNKECLMTLLAN